MAGCSHAPRPRALVLVALAASATGCDALLDTTATSSSTLVPLATVTTVAASTSTPASTPGSVATPTTLAEQPVAEWDGALFDIGRITSVGTTDDGGYRTIDFDRFSYVHPSLGAIDAAALQQEPLPVWWQDEPWANNNPGTRRFVLAPGAEVLTLSDDGRAAACAVPAPDPLPDPVWVVVDQSALEGLADDAPLALLTFAPTGPVTRIRFTHGC